MAKRNKTSFLFSVLPYSYSNYFPSIVTYTFEFQYPQLKMLVVPQELWDSYPQELSVWAKHDGTFCKMVIRQRHNKWLSQSHAVRMAGFSLGEWCFTASADPCVPQLADADLLVSARLFLQRKGELGKNNSRKLLWVQLQHVFGGCFSPSLKRLICGKLPNHRE